MVVSYMDFIICKKLPFIPILRNFPISDFLQIESKAFEKSTKKVFKVLFCDMCLRIIDLKRKMWSVVL